MGYQKYPQSANILVKSWAPCLLNEPIFGEQEVHILTSSKVLSPRFSAR